MKRRTMLAWSAAQCPAAPALAQAQRGRLRRLGWLGSGFGPDHPAAREVVDLMVATLRAKGWVLGENYVIDFRWAHGDASRYPTLADELIALQPDVPWGLETAARAFAARTRTIPIVLFADGDPLRSGFVPERKAAAVRLGVSVHKVSMCSPDDLVAGFAALAGDCLEALCLLPRPWRFARAAPLAAPCSQHRLPALTPFSGRARWASRCHGRCCCRPTR